MGKYFGERLRTGIPAPPGSPAAQAKGCLCSFESNEKVDHKTGEPWVIEPACTLHGAGSGYAARCEILTIRDEYKGRYGRASSLPADLDQVIALAQGRLAAMALLLGVEPEDLAKTLDEIVWEADLGEAARIAQGLELGPRLAHLATRTGRNEADLLAEALILGLRSLERDLIVAALGDQTQAALDDPGFVLDGSPGATEGLKTPLKQPKRKPR